MIPTMLTVEKRTVQRDSVCRTLFVLTLMLAHCAEIPPAGIPLQLALALAARVSLEWESCLVALSQSKSTFCEPPAQQRPPGS